LRWALRRSLCIKVADETDPHELELLKQRMRILLRDGLEPSDEVAQPREELVGPTEIESNPYRGLERAVS
jgi:hypothetical protein